MSTPSVTDFLTAVKKPNLQGKNWVMFEQTSTLAVKQKNVWGHFSGTSKCPTPADPKSPKDAEKKAIKAWEKSKSLAAYLLMLKVTTITHVKHRHKGTVAARWATIIVKFSSKSIIQCLMLHCNFLNMHANPSVNLHTECNRLRVVYEDLITFGVLISDSEYASIIISFLPPSFSECHHTRSQTQ
ncbi:hypothetical protein C8Q78DRAFT_967095 [Trametes maxima]|nr:hypothetical protein C8Q78DRAFT_967095 [Trametes maxima]